MTILGSVIDNMFWGQHNTCVNEDWYVLETCVNTIIVIMNEKAR